MIPLNDENPTIRTPYVTVALIVACVVVFLIQLGQGGNGSAMMAYRFGFIPSVLFGEDMRPPHLDGAGPVTMLFTSMFLHGGWLHLIGNMWFLWIFGNNIEDVLGHVRFFLFYLATGVLAALAQGFADPTSSVPMIGASGAISGILGAYIILFPHARVLTLVWLGFFVTTLRIAAGWFLGLWFVMQAFNALVSGSTGGGVAWLAHIGGFIAGVVLLLVLKPGRRSPPPRPPRPRRRGPWG